MVLRSPDISEFNELKSEVEELKTLVLQLKEQINKHEMADRPHKRYPM